ncbi:MAG: hypothetical protein AB7O78_06285 [Thermoleophilia bacterium]
MKLPLLVCACLSTLALAAGCGGGDDASQTLGSVTVTVTETLPVPPVVLPAPPATAPATVATDEPGGGDEAAIREVYDEYAAAFLDLDGTEACSRLSPAGEAQAVMEGKQQGFGDDCPSALRAGALAIKSFDGDDVAYTLDDVEVSGDSARATAVYRGSEGSTERAPTFERLGGGWYVGPDGG